MILIVLLFSLLSVSSIRGFCKDEFPTQCSTPDHLGTCSAFIAIGQHLGGSLESMCNIYWKDVNERWIISATCDSTTPGQIKDDCRASCNPTKCPGM